VHSKEVGFGSDAWAAYYWNELRVKPFRAFVFCVLFFFCWGHSLDVRAYAEKNAKQHA